MRGGVYVGALPGIYVGNRSFGARERSGCVQTPREHEVSTVRSGGRTPSRATLAVSSPYTPMLRLAFLLALAVGALAARPHIAPPLVVGAFSGMAPGGPVAGWEPLRLGDARPSTYTLVRDGGAVVVRAHAEDSASGLVRRVRIDLAEYPVMAWRWKVDGVIARGDVTRRDGDDYPARIYVTFDFPVSRLSFGDRVKYRALRVLGYRDIPTRALNYIWANRAGETRIVANPFTDWVRMVPVESGPANAGRWRSARRNVADDYRAAFGESPPAITGIAIMTDADNTGGEATASYGDLTMEER